MHWLSLIVALMLFSSYAFAADSPTSQPTFTNPILTTRDGADPWVVHFKDSYYLTGTFTRGIWILKSDSLTNWDSAQVVEAYAAPEDGPASHMTWAPEFYEFNKRWYLYFSATDEHDHNHRHFVMQSAGDDPLGPYEMKGRMDDYDHYAIDGSVLQLPDGRLFWMYTTGQLEIAPMDSPLHADTSKRALLTKATEPWERGWVEAPEALVHNGRVFVVYSAGHSGTPHYVLGLLELVGKDPLDPASWKRHAGPVFAPYVGAEGSVFTVGHNAFTKSPDGTEDWIVYHAKDWRNNKLDGFAGRTIRAQKFTWTKDGLPDFGKPIPSGVAIQKPAGEH